MGKLDRYIGSSVLVAILAVLGIILGLALILLAALALLQMHERRGSNRRFQLLRRRNDIAPHDRQQERKRGTLLGLHIRRRYPH